jgi:hypothetical protein
VRRLDHFAGLGGGDGSPGLPGDAEDDERDRQADERVSDLFAERHKVVGMLELVSVIVGLDGQRSPEEPEVSVRVRVGVRVDTVAVPMQDTVARGAHRCER